jgi:hypothetical protein
MIELPHHGHGPAGRDLSGDHQLQPLAGLFGNGVHDA